MIMPKTKPNAVIYHMTLSVLTTLSSTPQLLLLWYCDPAHHEQKFGPLLLLLGGKTSRVRTITAYSTNEGYSFTQPATCQPACTPQ
jgi:hypothetical protein